MVLYFDDDVDWLQAQTHFQLESVSAKKEAMVSLGVKGIGRVLNGSQYLKKITG